MNMHQFLIFESAARHLSISKAADEFFITQQAASSAIGKLEDELGKKLFNRSARSISLNEDGLNFMMTISPLVQQYKRTVAEIEKKCSEQKREVKIGVANGLLVSIGYEDYNAMIAHLQKKFERIQFTYIELPDLTIEEMITEKKLDIALSLCPYKHRELLFDLINQKTVNVLVREDDQEFKNKKELKISELKNRDIMLVTKEMQFNAYTREKCIEAGFSPKILLECSQLFTVLSHVEKGSAVFMGITSITPKKGIRAIPLDDKTFLWKSGIVYNSDISSDIELTLILKQMRLFFGLSGN